MPIVLNNGIDQILGIMGLNEYYCSIFVATNVISRKAFIEENLSLILVQ